MRRIAIALLTLLTLTSMTMPAASIAADDSTDPRVGPGGRIEVPGAGYALTLPDDWVYVRPSEEDIATILEELVEVAPGLAATVEAALTGGLGFSLLAYAEPSEGFAENCNVLDRVADGSSLELLAASEIVKLGALGDLVARGPELTYVELPFGRVARIDVGIEVPDISVDSSSFLFLDAEWAHTMTCTDDVRPPDAWGSIAETFELLPPTD